MKKIFELLKNNALFTGIEADDMAKMLNCLAARVQSYNKDEFVVISGDKAEFVGLIISGSVKILKEDLNGNATIIAELAAQELFAEVFACAGVELSPVTVQAAERSEILLVDYKRIIGTCPSACEFHARLIANMLRIIAKKSLMLNMKIEILSKRTTREKLLAFFDIQRDRASKFKIPYNREELARYLCVDRSAMSSELGKMRDEGLISFNKNEFEIL